MVLFKKTFIFYRPIKIETDKDGYITTVKDKDGNPLFENTGDTKFDMTYHENKLHQSQNNNGNDESIKDALKNAKTQNEY